MAYLPSFEYDIFISYAHVDNATKKGLTGWVAQFHEELALRLDKRLGRIGEAKIWWDDRLGGSHVFDQTIKRAVNRAAVFLAMTSEGYLASDYCREELDCFCQKAERERPGLFVGDRARVLNVLLDDTPHQRWPAKYGGTNGFHFHDEELGEPADVESKEFRVQLARLTSEICEILEAMKRAPPEQEEKKEDGGTFQVFIADTSSSLKNVRQRVQSELQQLKDVRVVGRVPPPYPAAEHEEEVRERVSAADLCVHMLDATPGREIEDQPEKSYLERQAELSLELARERFVWVPSDLRIEQVEDEAHKGLLRRLEGVTDAGDAGAQTGEGGAEGEGELIARPAGDNYKFVRGLPSAVARDLIGHIESLKRKRSSQPAAGGVVRRALLDTHVKDQRHVLELSGFLAEHQIVPLINFDEDTPRKSIESYEDQLRRANLLIVVYGGVPPEWVRERLYEALKFAVTHTQDCPLRACGVYVAPPRKRDEEKRFNVPLLNVDVLDNTERFDPETLRSLLSRIDG